MQHKHTMNWARLWRSIGVFIFIWPLVAVASNVWLPIQERSLEVVAGSVLDFSQITAHGTAGRAGWAIADPKGQIRLSGSQQPQRFLCASIVPSPPNGGVPDKAEADRWVTQLQRTGYNLVRLHFVDASLMSGRKGDFDFDPEALDRLHYLMARLKAAGMYWVLEGLASGNGAHGNVQPHQWVDKHGLKTRLYYDPDAVAHWKRLVTALWGRVNPYTGVAPLHDPALLGVILVNEGGIAFMTTLAGRYPPELARPFGAWLATRYPDDGTLKKAWVGEATARDRVGVSADVPGTVRGQGMRARDFAAFVAAREVEVYRELEAHLRARGFKGLVTSYNNWNFRHANVVRGALGWIDMHAYQSLPTQSGLKGSVMPQSSIFDNAGLYGRSLSTARQWGKPFTVTEHGHPFWNQWRHESAAWLPALAGFQGWDAICQFAELPVLLEYSPTGQGRRSAMYPFGVGADPIARGGERLAALLYLRGDVTPSPTRLVLNMDPVALFKGSKFWAQTPEHLSRMALVVGTGLNLQGGGLPKTGRDMQISLDSDAANWIEKARNAALRQGLILGIDPVSEMKEAGLLLPTNRTDIAAGVFETDTGEMVLDTARKRLMIDTDRSVAMTMRSGTMHTRVVDLDRLSAPATVAVGAVDDRVLKNSQRMLVWVLTDAANTGMEFMDAERTTLKRLGGFPVRIRGVTGQLSIRHARPAELRVWAVDQTGRRVAAVPSRVENGFLRFSIDNLIPKIGPVTYFEVAVR